MNLTRRPFSIVDRRCFLSRTLIGTGYMVATSTCVTSVASATKQDKYRGLKSKKYLG